MKQDILKPELDLKNIVLSDKRKALIQVLKDKRPDPNYTVELEAKLPDELETPAKQISRDISQGTPSRSLRNLSSEINGWGTESTNKT